MAPEKINNYNTFLLSKRDNYVNHLVRVGSKLLKKGEFNAKSFSKNFIIDKDEIIKKIEEKVKYEIDIEGISIVTNRDKEKRKDNMKTCFDSQLIDILRPHIDTFAKELNEVVQNSECCKHQEESNESMKTVIECESSGDKKEKNNKATFSANEDNDDDAYCVSQELMPGECSKIFVQKSRIDIVHSNMDDDIDFENDLIETIYVFRRKKC
ncbi:hypothetical protein PVAND_004316 [Polypedilum vanderplanki]|uniref:Uncharacterized protein n=1 Tax=Polypedilum vanderplanki TaxID=319348 RepID=A0A9J6BXS5_POLVA|nr:hypothetical protein PVAND_004316 [Polypedilum vanderplanki]